MPGGEVSARLSLSVDGTNRETVLRARGSDRSSCVHAKPRCRGNMGACFFCEKNSAAAWSFVPYNGATAMANRDDRRLDYSACMSRETRYSDQGPPALLVPTQTTPCREQLLCTNTIAYIRDSARVQTPIIYFGIRSRTGQDEFPIGSSSCMGFPPFGAIACM